MQKFQAYQNIRKISGVPKHRGEFIRTRALGRIQAYQNTRKIEAYQNDGKDSAVPKTPRKIQAYQNTKKSGLPKRWRAFSRTKNTEENSGVPKHWGEFKRTKTLEKFRLTKTMDTIQAYQTLRKIHAYENARAFRLHPRSGRERSSTPGRRQWHDRVNWAVTERHLGSEFFFFSFPLSFRKTTFSQYFITVQLYSTDFFSLSSM